MSRPTATLVDSPRLRLLTLCALYVAQGIPFGFVFITLKWILAGRGLSTGEIGGVLAMASAPWAFKWLWGPVIDAVGQRAMGRRRPWILLAQALMALTIGAMIAVTDLTSGVALLGALVFVHNVFNSLQDVAVDALAVDLLEESERGRVNGLMYASKYLGTIAGGAGMSALVAYSGLQGALILQVVVLGAIFMLPLLLRERPDDSWWGLGRPAPPSDGSVDDGGTFHSEPRQAGEFGAAVGEAFEVVKALFKDLFRAFSLRSTMLGVALAVTSKLAVGVLSTVAAVLYTKRLGFEPTYIGQLEGWAYVPGLAGAVIGGFLADRFGAKRMIAFGMLGLGALWIAFAAAEPWWSNKAIGIALLYAEPLFQSLATVAMFSLFMGISWPRVAATQFTAYMALLSVSTSLGQGLAGWFDAWFDYPGLYVAGAILQVAAVLLLFGIDPRQTRRELPQ